MSPARTAALIVAAGRGTRASGDAPKQYQTLGGATVLRRTLERLAESGMIGDIQVVIHADDLDRYHAATLGLARLRPPAIGGTTRQASVLRGLEAMRSDPPDFVLVHDAARPFVRDATIRRVLDALATADGAVPGHPPTDTVKLLGDDGRIETTLPRERLLAAQTPQGFRFAALLDAHWRAAVKGIEATDDAAIAERTGLVIASVEGDRDNIKLTYPQDFALAEARLSPPTPALLCRVGQGFDVHAFAAGDHVWLGGVRIAHDRALSGHSDADVLLHALTDAVLGALADGDIGRHFPPGDPQWAGASSDRFLAFAAARVRERGGMVDHLDGTLVCEYPRIGPHADAMRGRIAEIAALRPDQVSVKATTSERLGFTGRGEGIAAFATATIRLPEAI